MVDSLFLALAAAEAEKYRGATAPNPPVGACVVGAPEGAEKPGRVLGIGAHARAGADHAEVVALKAAAAAYGSAALRGATIYVTLEPCNHQGRTPPCTKALVEAGLGRVVYAERDPNKNVAGGGATALAAAGIAVERVPGHAECRRLLDGFAKRATTSLPWVVHKLAYRFDADGRPTLLPEAGHRTFTSQPSLVLAHEERRRCDAILTGAGTVLADRPRFDVRHVRDHDGKRRWVAVVTHGRQPLPTEWLAEQRELGHDVFTAASPREALEKLGALGALRVLVEGGPTLSEWVERERLWDERLVFIHRTEGDLVTTEVACSPES
ncbi:MAG: bifunctional diaminohydroxyphosphoribosylaminopyrimidine deaminase/5-amino-6-(5-phosphoribosylamino)uracil reductase RibD [Deltaproteobacteria bacterium]|nr:bifunctional diaminohydroxyphosphoribosylaminopyrimidine deaminase/5-amino-6-(5-phosphoribosylamino)uracil reductase RibD [Deltaproteobacteria bacterium]